MFNIQENLKKLPDCPGVYLHKDRLGQVIYVGKAINLKKRVRQYFQSSKNQHPKVRAMVSQIEEFEYITCGSEMEALILECNLIKKYEPKYNILLRDDKTYPYIKVTMGEDFPRVLKTRRVEKDGAKYFGPYSDVAAVNEVVDLLNSVYSLKRCATRRFPKNFRPCLNYHIGQCRGVCRLYMEGSHLDSLPERSEGSLPLPDKIRQDYAAAIDDILSFLSGHDKPMLSRLKKEMEDAAEAMRFEDAAKARDNIRAIEALSQKQRVTILGAGDMDMVLPLKGGRYVVLFYVRGGKLTGRESFPMQLPEAALDPSGAACPQDFPEAALDPSGATRPQDFTEENAKQKGSQGAMQTETLSEAKGLSKEQRQEEWKLEAVAEFLKQHYTEAPLVPQEILVSEELPETELLQEYLSTVRGSAVKLYVPKRGDKKALLDLAKRDVVVMANTIDERAEAAEERREAFRSEMEAVLRLWAEDHGVGGGAERSAAKELRSETYDISHTNGVDTVAGMVVFEGTKPCKKDYRRFKVHIDHPDDYASLQEVLGRRLAHAFPTPAQSGSAEQAGVNPSDRLASLDGHLPLQGRQNSKSYWPLPDLFLIDGGKGQVSAVEEVLEAWGIDDIPVIGMAKDDHHRTRAFVWSIKRPEDSGEAVQRPLASLGEGKGKNMGAEVGNTASPETENAVITEVNTADMPEAENAAGPEAKNAVSPEAENAAGSEAKNAASPKTENAVITEVNTADMPETENAAGPEAKNAVSPEAENAAFREFPLRDHPLLFKYAGTMQEEVHRFAIEYHRGLRGKRMTGSLLDNINGIGPTKRNALLAHFGSIAAIKKASIEELQGVPGITQGLAESIRAYFSNDIGLEAT